jgi:hypothetical protein
MLRGRMLILERVTHYDPNDGEKTTYNVGWPPFSGMAATGAFGNFLLNLGNILQKVVIK